MRPIDADELIKNVEKCSNDLSYTESRVVLGRLKMAIGMTKKVDPVKHGKWKYYVTIGCDEVYTHTVCGCFVRRKSLYCPLCGAKMDEGTE